MKRRAILGSSFLLTMPAMSKAQSNSVPCERDDCRLVDGMSTSTLVGTLHMTDKHGNALGPTVDPNTHTWTKQCVTCGRSFVASSKQGQFSGWADVTPKDKP